MSSLFLAALMISCACSTNNGQTGTDPVKKDIQYCAVAEAHLTDLCQRNPVGNQECCQMVKITPQGRTFAQVCQRVQEGAIFVNPQCISTVLNCAQVNTLCMQNNVVDDGGNK